MQRTSSKLIAMAALVGGFCCALPLSCAAAPGAGTTSEAPRPESTEHIVFGRIRSIEGSRLSIETRSKTVIQVDAKPAIQARRINVPVVGRAVRVHGTYDAKGVLHADNVQSAKDSELLWPADK